MAYDFNQASTQSMTNGSGEALLEESNLLCGEFGPKLEGKWGMTGCDRFSWPKWNLTSCSWTRRKALNCLSSAIHNVHLNTVSPVFYPGGGLEGRVGGTPAGYGR
jgi:hypothetical protein